MIGTLPDRPSMHLDRGYDSTKTRELLQILGYQPHLAARGLPAPIQPESAGRSSARTPSSTATASSAAAPTKRKIVVEFYLYLAAAVTVIRRLINRARNRYRWPTRPTTRRLR